MRILVLGAGGFVGTNLVQHLLRAGGQEVTAVDMDGWRLVGMDHEALSVHIFDVRREPERLCDLVASAEVAVNLVSRTGPATSVRAPMQVIESVLLANLGIVEACVRHATRLIQFSSCEVYGHPFGDSFREDRSGMHLGPVHEVRWTYAAAYQMLERVIYAHGLEEDLDYTVLRPFNLIGPHYDYLVPAGAMGGPRMFAHFMSALLTGGPMYLVDGGHRTRTFTHIDDLNAAVDILLRHPGAHNQIFNVGNPANTCTVGDVAALMCDLYVALTGRVPACDLVEVDAVTFYGEGYQDADRAQPDVSRLRALGWEPRHGLRRTFGDAMHSYLAHRLRGGMTAQPSTDAQTVG